MYLLITLIAIVGLVFMTDDKRKAPLSKAARGIMFCLIVVQSWALTQLVLGITSDPDQSRIYLLLGVSYTLLYYVINRSITDGNHKQLVLWALVATAVFQGLLGITEIGLNLDTNWVQKKFEHLSSATGTYANRNHLAWLLEAGIGVSIAIILAATRNRRSSPYDKSNSHILTAINARICLILLVAALILTRSRTGNTAILIAITLVTLLIIAANPKRRRIAIILLISMLVVDITMIGSLVGIEHLLDRFKVDSNLRLDIALRNTEFRDDIAAMSIPMFKDFWATGVGLGSYGIVFEQYYTGPGHLNYLFAHNDYLQIPIELGAFAAVVLFSTGLIALIALLKCIVTQNHNSDHSFGLLIALLSLSIHSITDFNLYIPASAIIMITILALATSNGNKANA